jgi:hypothetical protein
VHKPQKVDGISLRPIRDKAQEIVKGVDDPMVKFICQSRALYCYSEMKGRKCLARGEQMKLLPFLPEFIKRKRAEPGGVNQAGMTIRGKSA